MGGLNDIRGDMLIGEVVAKYPQAVPVFLKYGLHCVGCFVSPYETLEQGSLGHGMPRDAFEKMLSEANSKVSEWEQQKASQGGSDKPVWLTEKAAAQIKKIAEAEGKAGWGLRVSVEPGGCAGHSYQMDFEQAPAQDDVVVEAHGFKLFFEKELTDSISGTTIDYRDALQGAGFVMQNPNAKTTCSCGQSFSA